jgi:hypothetical protein
VTSNAGAVEGTLESAQQFDVMELERQASLLGVLPGTGAMILPMVGCDPRRPAGNGRNSFEAIVERVMSGRAIGVKLYPAMGFSPSATPTTEAATGRRSTTVCASSTTGVSVSTSQSPRIAPGRTA